MKRARVPDFLMDEIRRIARITAPLPTPKELAAKGSCSVRVVQYHLRKIALYEKRLAHYDKRKTG
jgi:hypothetical protein